MAARNEQKAEAESRRQEQEAAAALIMEERLQKLIAAAGLASRRHAEELIASGQVTVNGKVVDELGSKADPEKDHVTNFITAARNRVQKVYEVKVKGVPPEEAIERLRRGVALDDGTRTAPAKITRLEETTSNSWFEILLHQGRNQQIRRMFDLIGFSVVKLRRVRIGFLGDSGLSNGGWRLLTPDEVKRFMKKEQKEPRARSVKGVKRVKRRASHG